MTLGHSIGEYAAAWASGVMSLETACDLVVRRGALMQGARPGAMLAVALTRDVVEANLPDGLDLAAVNAADMCVVSGPAALVEVAAADLEGRGIFCRRLVTSHAFHSRMMEPILPAYREAVAAHRLAPPRAPMISNVTGRRITAEQAMDPDYWARHIREPVLFAAGVDALVDEGVELALEVGPGQALSSSVKRAGRFLRTINVMADAQARDPDARTFARALGTLWVEGAAVDLDTPYRDRPPRRISAPTTVYDRRPHGFGTPGWDGKAKPRLQDKQPLDRWFFTESWRRGAPPVSAEVPPSRHLLFGLADCPVAEALSARWRSVGHDVVVVRPGKRFRRRGAGAFDIDPAADADYRRLAEALGEGEFTRLTHLWNLGSAGRDLLDHDLGLASLLRIVNARVDRLLAPRIDVVTSGAADLMGGEPMNPRSAALKAFVKVAPQEEPLLTCRLVDLAAEWPAADAAERLAAVLDGGWSGPIGALRGEHVWTETVQPLDLGVPDDAQRPPASEGWLIVGGLGELGLTVARRLAGEGSTLVLTGRAGLPEKDAWAGCLADAAFPEDQKARILAVQALEATGARVVVVAGDASDREAMLRVRRVVGELGVRNLIYAAGLMSLGAIRSPPAYHEELQQHLRAKAVGVALCDELFADAGLERCVLFSSISTVLGGLGHCAYSAANHAADVVAGPGARLPWTVIRWDLWRTPRILASHRGSALLRNGIKADEGMDALELVLRRAPGQQVVVSAADLETRYETWVRKPSAKVRSDGGTRQETSDQPAMVSDLQGPVEVGLGAIWAEALGVSDILRDDDFFDLGGHSLLAVEIAARVRAAFGVAVPLETIFAERSIRQMSALIGRMLGETPAEGPGDDPARQPARAADREAERALN